MGRPGASPRSGWQASATICLVTGPAADDDEATARSFIGRMASATLRQSISCFSVAAATRPSRDLGDSSKSPGRRMSCLGVRGNNVTWEATEHYHGSDRRSRLSLLSQIMAVESGPIPPRMPHLLQQFPAQKPPYLPQLDISTHPILYLQFLLGIARARLFPEEVCAMSRDHSHPSREERVHTGECEETGRV